MANRIDDGTQPTAHTAVQAMIVRAQQAADKTGKAIGVHYDLATDQLSLVEMGPDLPADAIFLRVAAPYGGTAIATGGRVSAGVDGDAPEVKTAPV